MGYEVHPRRHSFVMPILLIGAGIYFLLVNLGYISPFSWAMMVRFWPVLLIAVGLDILFGRRSWIGALISGMLTLLIVGGLLWLLIVGPQHVKGLDWLEQRAPVLQQRSLQTPLDKVKEASLSIDWGSGDQRIRALPATSLDLLKGDATFYHSLTYDASCDEMRCDIRVAERFTPEQWFVFDEKPISLDLSLNPKAVYAMTVESGSGDKDFDFSGLQISGLELDSGSGELTLALPEGEYGVLIDAGSGDMRISLPGKAAVRLRLRSGSGDLYAPKMRLVDGKEHGRGTWETDNFNDAAERIDMEIKQGSGDLEVTFR